MATPPYDAETPQLYLERLAPNHLADFHTLCLVFTYDAEIFVRNISPPLLPLQPLPIPSSHLTSPPQHQTPPLEQSRAWMATSSLPAADRFGIMLKRACAAHQGEERRAGGRG